MRGRLGALERGCIPHCIPHGDHASVWIRMELEITGSVHLRISLGEVETESLSLGSFPEEFSLRKRR